MLDARPECQPVCSRPAVREADAPGVYDADPVHDALELHVRVPADHDVSLDRGQHVAEPLVGGCPEDHFLVTARGSVAEEDAANTFNVELGSVRKPRDECTVPVLELVDNPLADQPALGNLVTQELAIGIAADPDCVEIHDPVERLGRKRPSRHVAAENQLGVASLGQDGLERRGIPVDVVERRDRRATGTADRRWSPERRCRPRQSPANARAVARGRA